MSEVWIYGPAGGTTGSTARLVAELGFTPQVVDPEGALRPNGLGSRLPSAVVVVGDASETCRRIGEDDGFGEVAVLVAVDSQELDRGEGIAVGHELLVQPFTAAELQVRIARARRLAGGTDPGDVVRAGTLEINVATYQVTVAERPVNFTYMEYELLKFLATHPGRVFSREALLSRVWGYDYFGGARTVDVHVRRLRAKLGQEHAGRITTVRSVGYRWDGA